MDKKGLKGTAKKHKEPKRSKSAKKQIWQIKGSICMLDSWGRVTDKGSEVSTFAAAGRHHRPQHNRNIFFGPKMAIFNKLFQPSKMLLAHFANRLISKFLTRKSLDLIWSSREEQTFKLLRVTSMFSSANMSFLVHRSFCSEILRCPARPKNLEFSFKKDCGSFCCKMEIFAEWDCVGW